MKNTLLFAGALTLLLAACKQDGSNASTQTGVHTDTPTLVAGQWIALDFCSRANEYGSVLEAMNLAHLPYAYAFTFDPNKPDSVHCYNGKADWSLPVKFNVDTIELINARAGKSVYLVFHGNGTKDITMFDGTSGTVQMDNFIKSKANTRDGYSAFTTALNHNLFNGVMIPLGKGAGKKELQFTPGGFILNWDQYDRYNVCTNGDCFVSGNDIDVITFRNSKVENSEKAFGFRYGIHNDTLRVYNLADPDPNAPGAYEIKGIAYQFLRKPAEKN